MMWYDMIWHNMVWYDMILHVVVDFYNRMEYSNNYVTDLNNWYNNL